MWYYRYVYMFLYVCTYVSLSGIAKLAASAGVTRITMLPSQLSTALRILPDMGKIICIWNNNVWEQCRTICSYMIQYTCVVFLSLWIMV
jgi:hypothetical protein